MSLSRECAFSFDSVCRARGHEYCREGRARIVGVEDNVVFAAVHGSARRPYDVAIDFSWIGSGELVAECTCPRFEDGHLCKHIWATLLQIERQKLLQNADLLEGVRVLHAWEVEAEDEDLDDVVEVGDYQRSPSRRIPAPMPTGVPKSSPPAWLSQLSPLFAQSEYSESVVSAQWNKIAERRCEAWFVLNVADSLQRGGLAVDFFQREPRKDGSWGKIKRLSVRRGDMSELSDMADRQLLQLLVGNDAQNDTGYSAQYYRSPYYDSQTYSRAIVAPAMYSLLLPRLCATGRFVWLLDSSMPPEEAQAISWDEGEPWRLRLRVTSGSSDEAWALRGELVRQDQSRLLDEPVMLLAHGLVLFPESLARLDAADHFPWIVTLRRHPRVEIPRNDREPFLQRLWSAASLPEVELPEELQLPQVQGQPRGKLSIQSPDRHGRSNTLYANLRYLYGEYEVSFQDRRAAFVETDESRVIRRDLQAERVLLMQLAEAGIRLSSTYDRSRAELQFPVRSLMDIVDRLTAQGWLIESEGRLIRRAGSYRLSVTSGVDWFELDGQIDFDGVQVPLPRLLAALRSKQKYIRLDDGTQGLLPDEWLQRFGSLVDLGDDSQDTLRFSSAQALLLDALLAAQEDVQVDEPFDQLRKRLHNFDGILPGAEPRGFQGQLRPYQREGLGWLDFLREFRFGGCLADDMGLGKTVQVLALLQARKSRRLKQEEQRRPSIVVVPKSLVFNWVDEAARFTPRLRVLDYTGTGRDTHREQLDQFDLLVTTYGTLRRDIVNLKDVHFDYAILDESQAIKNANSQAAKACRLLRADHRLAMTGTPVENHLGELWSLFEFLNPGMLGRSSAFQAFVKNGQQDDRALKMLSQSLRPFLLRRTKDQVLTELPEKTEQTLYCDMTPKQRKLYEELREFYRQSLNQRVEEVGLDQAKIHVLEALLRLRQAACHPGLLDPKREDEPSAKLDLLLDQLEEIVAEGHKALVFSQFTSLLAIVRKQLDKRKIVYEYLDGQTRKRKDRVERFQNDPDCPLFLISLKAGGHGLNLTAADYVFILDPWWNPAVEAQAIDRAHRLGQTQHVFAYRLICRDTVEDKILELQRSKRELAEAIISADNSLIRQLTAEDLQLLLS